MTAKTWDVADAYKQVPLSDRAYHMDPYLAVYNPEVASTQIYKHRFLPFGSFASMTAFLRVSIALWTIGTRLFNLWSCSFDDFLGLFEVSLESHTDMIITMMLVGLVCVAA